MKIKWRSPSCVVVSFIVINSLMKSFGNMTSYQREVITVGGNYVAILLNRRVFSFQMGIKSIKLLSQVHISSFSDTKNFLQQVFKGQSLFFFLFWRLTASGDHPSNNNFLGETLFFFLSAPPPAIFQRFSSYYTIYSILYFYLYVVCFFFFNVKVYIPSFRIGGDFPSFHLLGFGAIFCHSVIPPFHHSTVLYCRAFLLGYRLAVSRLREAACWQ